MQMENVSDKASPPPADEKDQEVKSDVSAEQQKPAEKSKEAKRTESPPPPEQKTPIDTQNKVETSVEKPPEPREVMEEAAEESQDTMDLVIDEHTADEENRESGANETMDVDECGETEEQPKMRDEDKDSGEDNSELSVVTQIDVRQMSITDIPAVDVSQEAEVVTAKLQETKEDAPSVIEEEAADKTNETCEQTHKDAKENNQNFDVIEIDDDVEEWHHQFAKTAKKAKPVECAQPIISSPNPEDPKEDPTTKLPSEGDLKEPDATVEIPAELETVANDSIEAEEALLVAKAEEEPAAEPDQPKLPVGEDSQGAVPAFEETEDGSAEYDIFYQKECINHDCPHTHKQFFRAPQFAISHFKVTKKKFKGQFVCSDCYDTAVASYEKLCGLLDAKQPLYAVDLEAGRQDIVEIIDSSDEEDNDDRTQKERDGPHFCSDELNMLERELEGTIRRVFAHVGIQNQLTWCKTILNSRLQQVEEESAAHDAELRLLMKKSDAMHASLYQSAKIKIRQLQPLDLNTGRPYPISDSFVPDLPPNGEIERLPVDINGTYYAVKNKAIASWVPCKVVEPVEGTLGVQKNLKHYKIKFLKSQYSMLKTVSVKHLAYFEPPKVQLTTGARVIAYFDSSSLTRGKEKMLIQSAFYPGIIAEPMKPANRYRYLIFYDDGYTQYVYHEDVRLVCNVADNVWEDVHPGSRDFIQKYLTQPLMNRPMVQTQRGQNMVTESNGKWIYARVLDIDCSLVHMQFEGPRSHTEWIYRGSQRLGPVFKEYQKALQKDSVPAQPASRLPRRTEPFIRYTQDEETSAPVQQSIAMQQRDRPAEPRAVAKKSVSRPDSGAATSISSSSPLAAAAAAAQSRAAALAGNLPTVKHLNNSTIYLEDENTPKGKVVYYTAKRNLPPLKYQPHSCSPACLFKITHNLSLYSPLSKPLLSGWQRMIMRQKIKKVITYRSPCGRILRNMRDLHTYLRATHNSLNVDNFDFSPDTNCLAEYVIDKAFVTERDISGGQERMPIPLVNNYDTSMPPECRYAAQRIPTEGVMLNIDEDFLVGCDCDDDCSDKEKCSCWQLTYAGAKYGNPNTPMDEIGYQYKRLHEHVPTGIYECNSRCKCKSSCLNRVVQNSLQMKLQVFKTSNRGWGLRCLNDIPRGSFICIYAGHLLTEAKANEGGLDAGDEYFAELDYIEVAEQIKEGYESDVEPPEMDDEEDTYTPDQDDDDEFTPSKSYTARQRKSKSHSNTNFGSNEENDSQERQMINFNPNADMSENSIRESSIRRLFGKDEACYVMDAKITGNLGRYFNHSCSPNLFVQNVFVDTHDLRFPWVAFFASTNIRSGTELTWNYNYEVGVVPGKVLYCQCGAPNCRVRLL